MYNASVEQLCFQGLSVNQSCKVLKEEVGRGNPTSP